ARSDRARGAASRAPPVRRHERRRRRARDRGQCLPALCAHRRVRGRHRLLLASLGPEVSLRLKIWGCRGSVATPSPEPTKYGGNPSCVELMIDDETTVILDAGTGIRTLGLDLVRRPIRHVHLLLTHLHLDHLEGLRFFAPLWDENVTLDIWGPRSPVVSLRDRILRSFSPPLFPLDLRDVPPPASL